MSWTDGSLGGPVRMTELVSEIYYLDRDGGGATRVPLEKLMDEERTYTFSNGFGNLSFKGLAEDVFGDVGKNFLELKSPVSYGRKSLPGSIYVANSDPKNVKLGLFLPTLEHLE